MSLALRKTVLHFVLAVLDSLILRNTSYEVAQPIVEFLVGGLADYVIATQVHR